MAILWVGGEDTDWVNPGALTINVSAGTGFRAGYGRCGVKAASGLQLSKPIAGARTAGWWTVRVSGVPNTTNIACFGASRSGSSGNGLYVGSGTANARAALFKRDGSTFTKLAEEAGSSLAALAKLDLEIASLGASTTVRVYVNGTQVIEWTGDLSGIGVSDLDCFASNVSTFSPFGTELVIADEDSRLFSVVTLAPSGAGDANAWTGSYADIDEAVVSDADVMSTETPGAQALLALSDRPAGSFSVKAVKITARAAKGASGPGTLKLGIKSGGTIDVDAGHALATSFETKERLLAVNPVTSAAFTTTELDALQLALEAAA